MTILAVENVSFSIREKTLLNGISFSVPRNTITALLGPNGAGKTTLMRVIMGLQQLQPQHNTIITFDGQPINTLATHQRVAQGLVYLPQNLSLFNHMTVSENLDIIFEHHPYWHKQSWSSFCAEKKQWLEHMHLQQTLTQQVHTLSGGQKRKLEIARALLMHARCLMLDEPFAGVDPKSIHELAMIFKTLVQQNVSIIISDHHVDQLLSIAKLVYVIMHGNVLASGTPEEIIHDQHTREQYLGLHFYTHKDKKMLL